MVRKSTQPATLAAANERIADALRTAHHYVNSTGLSATRESLEHVIAILEHGDGGASDDADDRAAARSGGVPRL